MTGVCHLPRRVSREVVTNVVVVLASLALNGLLLLLIGVWSLFQSNLRMSATPPKQEELLISLEELMPEVIMPELAPEPVPAKPVFVETFSDQQVANAPERAPFESDRNTKAATKIVPSVPGEAPIPTQEGLKQIDGISMRDHNFADGPDGEIPRSAPARPGLPVVSGPPKPPESVVEKQSEAKPLDQAIPKETMERPEQTSPAETKMVAQPDQGKDEKAPVPPIAVPPGPAGGVAERMEMAKVDLPSRFREFTDDSGPKVPSAPTNKLEDAMPEKAPTLADPTVPFLQAPRVRPSAVMAPRPETNRSQASMPVPSGAAPQPMTNGAADRAAFSPARKLNTMKGSLSNTGENSVDAESTPVGIYKAAVARAVERRWHELRQKNGSFVSYGSLKIRFFVNRSGRTSGIRVTHQDAGAVLTNFSLAAIGSAAIPAMPKEVAEAFGNEPLEVNYDILIY